ncbi:Rpn family recombination-promoting nuclease/putative transposase [Caedibacter taeniospiralis]|uniref:Rpn family recombination-promoting nuclease/putative transposase n=1 Tax=Caedibacter taeniospiralis TaxID=28907 RepID=UPI0037BFDB60
MRFLDIRTDFAFKKVFGSEGSKPRLISFLNSVIQFDGDAKITDLTIVDPYNIPLLKGMKDSFVDVKAVLDNGCKVIIEMQVLSHAGLEKRILYNAAKNYSTQLLEGEKYHLLNPIIALTIVDFMMFEDNTRLISNFKLLEKEEFITYNDDLELIFIELPKFTKTLEELKNIQDQWLYFIKNAGSLAYIPHNLSTEVISAFDISNTAAMTEEELEVQYKKKEFIIVQKEIAEETEKAEKKASQAEEKARKAEEKARKAEAKAIEAEKKARKAEEKARKERKEGVKEGKAQVQIDIAKQLKAAGMSNAEISAMTGLSVDAVSELSQA